MVILLIITTAVILGFFFSVLSSALSLFEKTRNTVYHCPEHGHIGRADQGRKYCSTCGNIGKILVKCKRCGSAVWPNCRHCDKCGTKKETTYEE